MTVNETVCSIHRSSPLIALRSGSLMGSQRMILLRHPSGTRTKNGLSRCSKKATALALRKSPGKEERKAEKVVDRVLCVVERVKF